jgi:putative transposase
VGAGFSRLGFCPAAVVPAYPRSLSAFDYRGFHRYFLTVCTFERNHYFTDASNVFLVREQFLRASREQQFAIIAYCFMPDHLHLLVEGIREDASFKDFVARAKQYSGYYFKQRNKQTLWQRYGFERVLREGEETRGVIQYVIGNPVRSRLVNDLNDYPFWGSASYSREALIEYISRAG